MAPLVTVQGKASSFIIPNSCSNFGSPGCGSEADTSVIRKNGSPLGKTSGGGQVDAESAVAKFMGNGATAAKRLRRGLLDNLLNKRADGLLGKLGDALGGGKGGSGDSSGGASASGTKTAKGTVEDGVAKAAGSGATSGLPTVGADGVINMVMHQVRFHFPVAIRDVPRKPSLHNAVVQNALS